MELFTSEFRLLFTELQEKLSELLCVCVCVWYCRVCCICDVMSRQESATAGDDALSLSLSHTHIRLDGD